MQVLRCNTGALTGSTTQQSSWRGDEWTTASPSNRMHARAAACRDHLNLVFTGHIDAGKSTLAGQILFVTVGTHARAVTVCQAAACACVRACCCRAGACIFQPAAIELLGVHAPHVALPAAHMARWMVCTEAGWLAGWHLWILVWLGLAGRLPGRLK